MVEQSLLHITLNMNHRRRSPRSEVSQEAIALLSALIQKSAFPIPGQAAYRCNVFEPQGRRCSCFQVLDADGVSLVTFGVGLGSGLLAGSVDRLTCPRQISESQDQDTVGKCSPSDSLGWRPSRTCTACWFPGDEVAGRFCEMPFVVGAGSGAESSGPWCGVGELMGSQIPAFSIETRSPNSSIIFLSYSGRGSRRLMAVTVSRRSHTW